MKKHPRDSTNTPTGQAPDATGHRHVRPSATDGDAPVTTDIPISRPQPVQRGLSTLISSQTLQERIWLRSLSLANRFRVIRTLDIAAHCFPERGFKAALTAAQRAVRGLVKAQLLRRYKTDRHMTVYGLTQRGAAWLAERGVDAAASLRRVSDMSNPEHRLWAQFLVVCAEARQIRAMSESELMRELCVVFQGKENPTSLLEVTTVGAGRKRQTTLRPDAVFYEGDGLCWVEVDRSARGADRAASLRALALSVGSKVKTGQELRTVVVYTRNDRITNRVLATLRELAQQTESVSLQEGRRQLRETAPGSFEVWVSRERKLSDGRGRLVDALAGHVVVEALPVWLPRYRIDGRGQNSDAGWFSDRELPYRKPEGTPGWPTTRSPLLKPPEE